MSYFNRYIDIDSSYRDRVQYPNVGDFVMPMNSKGGGQDAYTAVDPVALSFPVDTGLLATTGALFTPIPSLPAFTFLELELSPGSREQTNFYVGMWINFPYFSNDYMLIVYYNYTSGGKHTILTLTNPFGGGPYPGLGEPYFIRYNLPMQLPGGGYTQTSGNPVSTNEIDLGASASSQDDYYTGKYLFIPPYGAGATTLLPYLKQIPTFAYQWALITAYDGATKIATLQSKLLTALPLGTKYEILIFSYDNFRPLVYNGTEVFNNARCSSVSLTNCTVPAFLPLSNINSGFITDYPFVWVAVYSAKGSTFQQPIISSSPAAREALFKCNVSQYTPSAYFSLSSAIGNQNVSFRVNDDLRVRILLPDGSPIRFNPAYYTFYTDTFTFFNGLNFPIPPDPRTQVQVTLNVSFSS